MAVNDGRGDEVVRERLQELLEDGASESERRELDELLRDSEEAREEWERLRRLDALLAEAIPEPWTAARTDRVLTALGVEESRAGVRAHWITGPLPNTDPRLPEPQSMTIRGVSHYGAPHREVAWAESLRALQDTPLEDTVRPRNAQTWGNG